ncbi:hypothetical protein OF820_05570 [Oceanotoga sp. DSM 15011]|uniref:hypothetical protein n=1 Tax=Oceanotoga sp. DSM 15011 TaxID=2984951 RepID=UPI0021F47529|nr:hypothetical protein [Oceanotoga sp. DSM 15011]UYP01153.1 hypothetical protein OF820_05570 [Oceanotoga sp. DSM 15011]
MNINEFINIIDDEIMSFAELKEDQVFSKIEKKELLNYIKKPINIGKEEALIYKNKSIEDLCYEFGIKINFINKSQDKDLIAIRADYCDYDKNINIYTDSIYKMASSFKSLNFNNINSDDIINIHLAHEFFHFLEYNKIGLVNEKLPKVININFLGIKKFSTVLKTREIGAHIFCKNMMNLKFHPKCIDYIYLISSKQLKIEEILKYFNDLKYEYEYYKREDV